jgi:hypothetical protein
VRSLGRNIGVAILSRIPQSEITLRDPIIDIRATR